MRIYYSLTNLDGSVNYSSFDDTYETAPVGSVLYPDQAAQQVDIDAYLASIDTAANAALSAADAAKEAEAQAVYDEIIAIHPTLALSVAKLIYAPFVP